MTNRVFLPARQAGDRFLGSLNGFQIWPLAGRYDNPIPTGSLAPCLKIQAQLQDVSSRRKKNGFLDYVRIGPAHIKYRKQMTSPFLPHPARPFLRAAFTERSTTVYVPSSGLGPPLPQASVSLPPEPTLACGLGGGGYQFGRLEKKPSTL
jgi:hypothetical protein